jgi:hypothetical protein
MYLAKDALIAPPHHPIKAAHPIGDTLIIYVRLFGYSFKFPLPELATHAKELGILLYEKTCLVFRQTTEPVSPALSHCELQDVVGRTALQM